MSSRSMLDRPQLAKSEIARRLFLVIEMALAAADRAEQEANQHDKQESQTAVQ